jgi:hypothetical protein
MIEKQDFRAKLDDEEWRQTMNRKRKYLPGCLQHAVREMPPGRLIPSPSDAVASSTNFYFTRRTAVSDPRFHVPHNGGCTSSSLITSRVSYSVRALLILQNCFQFMIQRSFPITHCIGIRAVGLPSCQVVTLLLRSRLSTCPNTLHGSSAMHNTSPFAQISQPSLHSRLAFSLQKMP